MAITLKDLKPKKLGEVVRELNYKDLLTLTMRISDDKQFASAMAKIQAPKAMTKNQLSKANNTGDEISMGEAMLYLIGEYLITDWDILDQDGNKAKINGDNFIALCASVGDDDENAEFVGFISDSFTEMTAEFREQGDETKKKPSTRSTGTKKAAK